MKWWMIGHISELKTFFVQFPIHDTFHEMNSQMFWPIPRDTFSIWLSSVFFSCIDVVYLVNIIFRRFETQRCVLSPAKSCYDMNLIWYLLLIGRRWRTIWISLCMMICRFPLFSATMKNVCREKWLYRVRLNCSCPFKRHDVSESNETSYSSSHQSLCYSSDNDELKSIWSNLDRVQKMMSSWILRDRWRSPNERADSRLNYHSITLHISDIILRYHWCREVFEERNINSYIFQNVWKTERSKWHGSFTEVDLQWT